MFPQLIHVPPDVSFLHESKSNINKSTKQKHNSKAHENENEVENKHFKAKYIINYLQLLECNINIHQILQQLHQRFFRLKKKL
jgi:hypothetical protein